MQGHQHRRDSVCTSDIEYIAAYKIVAHDFVSD
jgi:hypothetical protein